MAIDLTIHQTESSDAIRLSTSFEIQEKAFELWFEIPIAFKEYVTDTGDAFLLATLFPAMRANLPIRIHNRSVSRSLLRNLQEVQRAWYQWKPRDYAIVPIECTVSEDKIRAKEVVLSAFTGGVDGAFVLWNNLVNQENQFPYPIEAMMYVEGFHIPLQEKEASAKLTRDLRKIAEVLQIEFITVRTNLRRFGNWYDFHGAALASCLSLFKRKFTSGMLGSSHPYAYLRFPWGSNPVTDTLMSSSDFSILNYGGGFTRIQKIEKLSTWSPFQEVVNVCIRSYYSNCGRCEKCIRTLLSYRALGLPAPLTFQETTLNPIKILTLRAYQPQEIKDYTTIVQTAERQRRQASTFYWLMINIFMNRLTRFLIALIGKDPFAIFNQRRSKKLYQKEL
jgi:hypothetical protein